MEKQQVCTQEQVLLSHSLEQLFPRYDGTTTSLLEVCFQTTVHAHLLLQETAQLDFDIAEAPFSKGDVVIDHRVLLQHEENDQNLLYAASILAPDALPMQVYLGIQDMHYPRPLDHLFQNVPVCRQILSCEQEPAGDFLSGYFSIDPQSPCLVRTSLLCFDAGPALFTQEIIPCRSSCTKKRR